MINNEKTEFSKLVCTFQPCKYILSRSVVALYNIQIVHSWHCPLLCTKVCNTDSMLFTINILYISIISDENTLIARMGSPEGSHRISVIHTRPSVICNPNISEDRADDNAHDMFVMNNRSEQYEKESKYARLTNHIDGYNTPCERHSLTPTTQVNPKRSSF